MKRVLRRLKYAYYIPRNLYSRQILQPLRLQIVNFAVTYRCQSNCKYCNIHKNQSRIEDELSVSEIREYLQPLSIFKNVDFFSLTGGEPTLRKDLVDVCQVIKEACPNAKIGFPTNCLTSNVVEIIEKIICEVDPDLSLGLSVDGFEETNDFQRGVPGHFQKVMATAKILKEKGIKFGLGSTLTTFNIEQQQMFENWLLSQGYPHGYDVASESGNYYRNEGELQSMSILDSPNRSHYVELLKNLSKTGIHSDYSYYLPKYVQFQKQIFPCFSGYSSIFLDCYGDVYPCIHLNAKLGSLRESSFEEIWFGSKAKSARRLIRDKKCHCWTQCECKTTLRNLVYPSFLARLQRKTKRSLS